MFNGITKGKIEFFFEKINNTSKYIIYLNVLFIFLQKNKKNPLLRTLNIASKT